MKHRATVLCIREDRILPVARERGRWAFPGGRCKPREALSQAAVRELFEETQLAVACTDDLFQFWGAHTRHFVFVARLSPAAEARPVNEIARCRWVKLRGVKNLPASIVTKAIADYLLRAHGTARHRFHTGMPRVAWRSSANGATDFTGTNAPPHV